MLLAKSTGYSAAEVVCATFLIFLFQSKLIFPCRSLPWNIHYYINFFLFYLLIKVMLRLLLHLLFNYRLPIFTDVWQIMVVKLAEFRISIPILLLNPRPPIKQLLLQISLNRSLRRVIVIRRERRATWFSCSLVFVFFSCVVVIYIWHRLIMLPLYLLHLNSLATDAHVPHLGLFRVHDV